MQQKITFLLVLMSVFIGNAQVTNEGKPISWSLDNIENLDPVMMPKFDLKKLQAEDLVNDQRKDMPWRFGYEMMVDHGLSNSGQWTTLDNGDRIWRIRFVSKGAKSMNFFFDKFFIPVGATLYLYNNDRSDLLGAYTSDQNNENMALGTWMVKGSDIWLEYHEPKSKINEGNLNILKVIHGYRSSDDYLKSPDDDLNSSGNCNYDVDCSIPIINTLKETNKKSVALIIVNNTGHCSGALINNTNNDGKPYFLTANHCYSDPAAWSFRFNWISPNPVCAQNTNSTNMTGHYTISGATLKARRTESDFCLVEINSPIPTAWGRKWAGWERSTVAPTFVFGIHHPSGDIMKVCYDNGAPAALNNNGNYWRVTDWFQGVTEGGSSGSPFFNNQGRIIGQLWRGNAQCNGLVDNGGTDDYGRFDISWNTGTTPATRLRDWLDPSGSNPTNLDFYPSNTVFQNNAKISVSNINENVCGTEIVPVLTIANAGTATMTSATITYRLNNGAVSTINWTGSLTQDQTEDIVLEPVAVSVSGSNTFTATIANPNGVQDQFTGDNSSTTNFSLAATNETSLVNVRIVTDQYGSETTWQLTNSIGMLVGSGGPYANSTTYNVPVAITEDDCYIFTIFDSEGDGICCTYGNGSYSLTTSNNTVIKTGGAFGASEATLFKVVTNLSNDDFNLASIKVYPNPSNGVFTLSMDKIGSTEYEVYNILGQVVKSGKFNADSQQKIDLSNNSNGLYILKVKDLESNKSMNFKLMKK